MTSWEQPFAERVAVVVGNQLRIANARFDEALNGLRPWGLIDELMDDLIQMDPASQPWSELRKKYHGLPGRRREKVTIRLNPPVEYVEVYQ